MALMNLDTDTDFGFLNGTKRKNIILSAKMQAQKVIIVAHM